MRIAVIGHIRHPIAEPFMGGMESHAHALVRGLIGRGHDVALFASGSSDTSLPLHPIVADHYEASLPWAQWRGTGRLRAFLTDAYRTAWDAIRTYGFDIVHNNSLFAPLLSWGKADGVPMLTSMHVPPFAELSDAVAASAWPGQHYTVTSAQQARAWAGASRFHVAHNGIDLDAWSPGLRRTGEGLWCGRITQTKGTADALAAAHRADLSLAVVGPIDCLDYYRDAVMPLLDSRRRHIGQLAGPALTDTMRRAAFLVATPKWDEPFGLTVVEAMACAVPVVAYDRGAMREVIDDAGMLVPPDDIPALATAMARAAGSCGERGRVRARAMFSVEAMIARYEACYAATLSGAAEACAASNEARKAAVLA